VRPLIANPDGSPSDISRAHQIRCPEPGWWDVAGGKLTTYRLMAEQTVDQIVCHLSAAAKPCATADELLLPVGETQRYSGILPAPKTREAVEHFVRHEWALRLEDVLLRRGGWAHYGQMTDAEVEEVAQWFATAAGWPAGRLESELEHWRTSCQRRGC
jgi:glycerol-3-phosphate dehydrogenase